LFFLLFLYNLVGYGPIQTKNVGEIQIQIIQKKFFCAFTFDMLFYHKN